AWLQQRAGAVFGSRLAHFLQVSGLKIRRWRLSSAATRWGSCTSDGNIMLNWRLIHFAPSIIDYVIAHELAHLREMNHSRDFWAEVGNIMPDYEAAKNVLRRHDPATLPQFYAAPMELRQLRYFVKVAECGSMGRAAADLGVVTSAFSQQISRLESELSRRLLTRTSTGVTPTDAGLAFLRQAQLALRHADGAAQAAKQSRLTGQVSIGLPATTATVLARPFMNAMRERYPDVRVRLVATLSGYLTSMLNARQLDLAIVFGAESARRWSVLPLVDERLFLIACPDLPGLPP